MKAMLFGLLAMSISWNVNAGEGGMKDMVSNFGFQETQTRLENAIKEKGLTQFAKIDHADGAQKAGLSMRPATVTIFGAPKGGTPFMVATPRAAIDFPLKALVWESAEGKVFVSYYPVSAIVDRHRIQGQDELAKKLVGVQAAIAKAATE